MFILGSVGHTETRALTAVLFLGLYQFIIEGYYKGPDNYLVSRERKLGGEKHRASQSSMGKPLSQH